MYSPEYTGPIEGYVKNHLRKNFWRVQRTMEYEDCLQESKLLFCELKAKYPVVDTPQWFMSLFKTSWFHHFSDLANSDTKIRTVRLSSDFTVDEDSDGFDFIASSIVGDSDNVGIMEVMVRQAPSEVRMVISLFLNAPSELLDLVATACRKRGKGSPRSKENKMLCQMLGISPSTDLLGTVHDYFQQ